MRDAKAKPIEPFMRKRGQPRVPGSGRKKGTPNRQVVAARELVSQMINSAEYQYRLRRDFTRRHLHPSIEALMWAYHLGKPKESIEVSGQLDVTQKLTAERDLIRSTLDISELEALAAESQATLDRALSNARARQLVAGPQDIVVKAEQAE